jgi:hypothetical protein
LEEKGMMLKRKTGRRIRRKKKRGEGRGAREE